MGARTAEILNDFRPEATLRADLEDMYEFRARYGRAPGCELHEASDLAWFATGVDDELFNGILRFEATDSESDAKVRSVMEQFRARRVPYHWMVTPAMRPSDLAGRLKALGFRHLFPILGMALVLATMEKTPVPDGFTIRRVLDRPMLEQWVRIMVTSFEATQRAVPGAVDLEERLGLDWTLPGRRYLGLLDGEPVATSLGFFHGGVAGVHYVTTLPEARGRGIGTTMTAAPLEEARAMGYRIGVLQASPAGASVYRKMGFRTHAEYPLFVSP